MSYLLLYIRYLNCTKKEICCIKILVTEEVLFLIFIWWKMKPTFCFQNKNCFVFFIHISGWNNYFMYCEVCSSVLYTHIIINCFWNISNSSLQNNNSYILSSKHSLYYKNYLVPKLHVKPVLTSSIQIKCIWLTDQCMWILCQMYVLILTFARSYVWKSHVVVRV